jgi:hypothetical protein
MSWRQRLIDEQVGAVRVALTGAPVEAISFDFVNCLVAVTVSENANTNTEEAIIERARAATTAGAYARRPAEYPRRNKSAR